MKKLLLILTVSITSLTFGQVTLEHSYTSEMGYDGNNVFYTQNGISYYTFNTTTNAISFYNSTHTLITTTNIPTDANYQPNGIFLITDKLFNSDNSIEFILLSQNTNYPANGLDYWKMTLYNDAGTVIQQFGNKTVASVKKGNADTYKLVVSSPGVYDVYSLTGTLTVQQQTLLNKSSFAFPNPTSDNITISSKLSNGETATLEVFSINGTKVVEKEITGNDTGINVDVSNLSSGVYIYKINGETNKFIKK